MDRLLVGTNLFSNNYDFFVFDIDNNRYGDDDTLLAVGPVGTVNCIHDENIPHCYHKTLNSP